ncbi:Small auxin-up RNA [Sesbania bispinosa]|nr:Small auxin-up RNA [Sesbania bispinosa]
MSPATGNCSKIRHIVRVRQMLMRWRKKSCVKAPFDVPAGHVAVCVGPSSMRFVVRTTYLNHPIFQKLLLQAEEEYGFCNHGPLTIPCDESLFQEHLRVMSRSESTRFSNLEDLQRRCHVDVPSFLDVVGESTSTSRPLLHDQPIC